MSLFLQFMVFPSFSWPNQEIKGGKLQVEPGDRLEANIFRHKWFMKLESFFLSFVTYPFYIPFILYIYILLWSHSDGCTTKNVFSQAMSLAWNSIATDVASLGELPAMPLPPPLWRVPKSQERSRCFFLENDVKKHGKFRNHHLKDYCSWQFVCFWTSDISQADNWHPYPNSRAILEVEDNKTLINRTGNDAKAQHENTTGDTSPLSSN